MICFRFLLLLLHRPKALFEKSKFEKCNEVSKLANRNPLEHKIKLSYNISEHYLVQKSFEVETIFADHVSGKVAQNKKLSGNGLGMGLIKRALSINGCKICTIPGEKKIINNTEFGDNIFRFMFPVR